MGDLTQLVLPADMQQERQLSQMDCVFADSLNSRDY